MNETVGGVNCIALAAFHHAGCLFSNHGALADPNL